MKKILTLAAVFCFIVSISPRNVFAQVGNNQSKIDSLNSLYGLAASQAQQFIALERQRDARIKAINKQTIPEQERRTKIKQTRHQFQAEVKGIMTPDQVVRFESTLAENDNSYKAYNKILNEYTAAVKALNAQEVHKPKMAREALRMQYKARLIPIVGERKAEVLINQLNLELISRQSEIREMNNLSYSDKIELSKLKRKQAKQMDRINKENIPVQAKKAKREQQRQEYDRKIETTVGGAKASELRQLRETAFERQARRKVGLNEQQIVLLKDLENKRTYEIQITDQSNTTSSEKYNKIVEVDAETDAKIRGVMSAEQYNKYNAHRAKMQSRKRQ